MTRKRDDDEDDEPKGKGKGKSGGRGGDGFSWRSENAVETGLFSSGPAHIKEVVQDRFKYSTGEVAEAIILVLEREGEEYEQPYTVGKGWKVKSGKLVPVSGQTGLAKNSNANRHLVVPFEKAIEDSKGDVDEVMADFPDCLAELDVIVTRVEQEQRDDRRGRGRDRDRDDRRRGRDQDRGPRTILEIEEIVGAPWIKGGKKRKKKDEDEDEDKPKRGRGREEEDEDEEEEDESPKRRRGGKDKDDREDDDEDEKPRHRNRKTEDDDEDAANAKGKGKKGDEDEDEDDEEVDDDDDEALREEGGEALLTALEKAGKPIRLKDLADALAPLLKKHKQADDIIELMTSKKELEREKGWTFDGKSIALDE